MYSIEDVWEQAGEDDFAVELTLSLYTSRLVYGIQIYRDHKTSNIYIMNTQVKGDWHIPLTQDEVNIFLEKGWRYGCYILSLSNYRSKLDRVKEMIKSEMNGKKRGKRIHSLKTQRENVLKKYTEINNKLNKLNYGNSKNNEEADNI